MTPDTSLSTPTLERTNPPLIAEATETFLEAAAPTPDEIAAEAYALFCARGQEHGHDVEDWLAAEELLWQRRRVASA